MTWTLQPSDPRLSWQGAISLESNDEWTQPWRIPHEARGLFHEQLVERAAMPAGVRIAFVSDTQTIAGEVVPYPEASPLDVMCDGELVASVDLDGRDRFQVDDLPHGEKVIELWLPQFGEFRLRTLALSDGASLQPHADSRPRWITYGSSITQCRTAASPSQTWPALAAQAHDLNLTCLGFGGQCHLDPMIARMVRDQPADYLSMCVGININGGATLNQRTFRSGIIGFVQIVREKHPDTPFVLMSPICSPPREETPNAVGFTLRAMRTEVAAAVDALRAHGDKQVHYVDGLEIFGPESAHLLPDDLHPNAEGYRLMGERFAQQVAARFFHAPVSA